MDGLLVHGGELPGPQPCFNGGTGIRWTASTPTLRTTRIPRRFCTRMISRTRRGFRSWKTACCSRRRSWWTTEYCAAPSTHEEVWRLRALLQGLFDKEIGVAPVRSTPIGRTSRGKLSPTHEYALFYGGESAVPGSLEKTEKEKKRYPLVDEQGHYAWRNLLRTGTNDLRSDRPKLYYPIYVDGDDAIRIPAMEWDEQNSEYRILEQSRNDETVVWPIKEQNGKKDREELGAWLGPSFERNTNAG